MAKLIVKRANEYMNMTRKINLYIDGNKVGVIANNKTEEFEIPEGTHTIKAKVDWCGSRDFQFSVSTGETKYVKLSGIPYASPVLLTWAILFVLNLMLSFSTGQNFGLYFTIPLAIILVYYFTIGRNDYLRITEHNPFQ